MAVVEQLECAAFAISHGGHQLCIGPVLSAVHHA